MQVHQNKTLIQFSATVGTTSLASPVQFFDPPIPALCLGTLGIALHCLALLIFLVLVTHVVCMKPIGPQLILKFFMCIVVMLVFLV